MKPLDMKHLTTSGAKKALLSIAVSGLLLQACQPPQYKTYADGETPPPIEITNESVLLAPEHILAIKSERYQPSLRLLGKTVPIAEETLTSPARVEVVEVMAQSGERVRKGDTLLTLKVVAPKASSSAGAQPTARKLTSANSAASAAAAQTDANNHQNAEEQQKAPEASNSALTSAADTAAKPQDKPANQKTANAAGSQNSESPETAKNKETPKTAETTGTAQSVAETQGDDEESATTATQAPADNRQPSGVAFCGDANSRKHRKPN